MLPVDDFRFIVANAPLISIDLLVHNAAGDVLLGLRGNRPAQGFWFVPGGRIHKNESIAAAFQRITQAELGRQFTLADAAFDGVYEHFYNDSAFDPDSSTHYVVLAYRLRIGNLDSMSLPKEQHSTYRWLAAAAVAEDTSVHAHSRAYFASAAVEPIISTS